MMINNVLLGEVKRHYKTVIILALLAVAFQLFTDYLFKRDTPEELNLLLTDSQNDSDLMEQIGGYRSYEFSYNNDKRDAKEEYEFEVTLFGKEAYVNFEGFTRYNPKVDNWFIIKCDTLIKKY